MINKYELDAGIKVETEHRATYKWMCDFFNKNKKAPDFLQFCMHIAIDHLSKETPKYYERLKKAGL